MLLQRDLLGELVERLLIGLGQRGLVQAELNGSVGRRLVVVEVLDRSLQSVEGGAQTGSLLVGLTCGVACSQGLLIGGVGVVYALLGLAVNFFDFAGVLGADLVELAHLVV